MTTLRLEAPTVCRIEDPPDIRTLESHLHYKDKKVQYELNRLKHSQWMKKKLGEEKWTEEIERLKGERVKSLLFQDDHGLWTYSGLIKPLARNLQAGIGETRYAVPAPQLLPWHEKLPFDLHPYQTEALAALLAEVNAGEAIEGPRGVEMGTGLGKSAIIFHLIKALGLRTMVMAPNVSVARQLYEGEGGKGGLKAAFGAKYVGLYGDTKKETDKLITVGIAGSLTRVEPGTAAWNYFRGCNVFIADESHLCPAATLSKVCFGLMAPAQYRFFFSATQLRTDGLDLLLDAITGPIVYRKSVKEGIDEGYLAKISTIMVRLTSESNYRSRDVLEMTRQHLFYNAKVNRIAGLISNLRVDQGKSVLVLVEELPQFAELLPYLKHEVRFAYGGDGRSYTCPVHQKVSKPKSGFCHCGQHLIKAPNPVPKEYQGQDNADLVRDFNAGKFPILVGTSCISTGTDIKANGATVYLRGGTSEIEVMQGAIGRSTRLHPPIGKTSCEVIDFEVYNIDDLARHAAIRAGYYGRVGPVREWSL